MKNQLSTSIPLFGSIFVPVLYLISHSYYLYTFMDFYLFNLFPYQGSNQNDYNKHQQKHKLLLKTFHKIRVCQK